MGGQLSLQVNAAGIDPPFDQQHCQPGEGEPPPELQSALDPAAGLDLTDLSRGLGIGQDVAFVGVQQVDRNLLVLRNGRIGRVDADAIQGRQDEVAGSGDRDADVAVRALQGDLG